MPNLKSLVVKNLYRLNPLRWISGAWRRFRNWRRARFSELDYVVFSLGGEIPALPESRSWIQTRIFGETPLSLWEIDEAFTRIAKDARIKGVILSLHTPALSLADMQTLRDSILRLRESGKRVIAYAQMYDLSTYLLASACEQILMQHGGEVAVTGLAQQSYFLKDALDAVGIKMDVIAITPYKGAMDQLSRSEMSPEGREQLEWLIDSRYNLIVSAIAESRLLSPDAVREMIDNAPYLDVSALEKGFIDALLYEEDLPAHLQADHLLEWDKARRKLLIDAPKPIGKYVAILPITGMMMPGEGGEPPIDIPIPIPFIGGERAGDVSIVQQIRALAADENAAAVVVYIDSGGGAAIAAEAMTAALHTLGKDRPIVAYMNGVAASGGYMVACPAKHIVAQPGTITGSIGVVMAKAVTGSLEEKLLIKSTTITRGANADLYSTSAPFTEAQRAHVRASIEHTYQQFITEVAKSRGMTLEAVDAVGGGRVWTGVQALDRGLVDELGGLREAVSKARQLANLPADTPMHVFEADQDEWLPPLAAKVTDPAASITYLLDGARGLLNGQALTITPLEIR